MIANKSSVTQTEKLPNGLMLYTCIRIPGLNLSSGAFSYQGRRAAGCLGCHKFLQSNACTVPQFDHACLLASFHTFLSASFMILPTIWCYTLQNSSYHLMLYNLSCWPYKKITKDRVRWEEGSSYRSPSANLLNWCHNGQWLGLLLHTINVQKQQNKVNYILLAILALHFCPV